MIVACQTCRSTFDDEFRSTLCPHGTFPANDGRNGFAHHPESHLQGPTCDRCEGTGKAYGADRPFESSGPGTYPGPCPVCRGSGVEPIDPGDWTVKNLAPNG